MPEAHDSDERFPKSVRLLRGAEFKRVYERRASVADDALIVYACENNLDYSRLGLTVSRKIGNAVERNRWKRIIREVFRHCRALLPAGLDLVVSPRPGAAAESKRVAQSLPRLIERAARKLKKSGAAEKS